MFESTTIFTGAVLAGKGAEKRGEGRRWAGGIRRARSDGLEYRVDLLVQIRPTLEIFGLQ